MYFSITAVLSLLQYVSLDFLVSFDFAYEQQLIVNVQKLVHVIFPYIAILLPFVMSSSHYSFVGLSPLLYCCSFTLHCFFMYKGPISVLKRGVF